MPLINKEAGARGINFDAAALELFIHRVSESSRQMISEIEKLDLYLGADRRTVMPEDVERMVPLSLIHIYGLRSFQPFHRPRRAWLSSGTA